MQDEHIHAIVPQSEVDRFMPILIEGKIYDIQNFKVVENNRNYRPVHHMFKLIFSSETSLHEVELPAVNIPLHKFEILPYPEIPNRFNDDTYLTGKI